AASRAGMAIGEPGHRWRSGVSDRLAADPPVPIPPPPQGDRTVTLSPSRRHLVAALVLGSLTLPAQALPADVPSTLWASTAVTNLVEKWPILGLSPQGHFNGHQDVTRY